MAAFVFAVLLVEVERGQPRRVSASHAGVEVSSRRSSRAVPWERLRRVRGPRAVGFEPLDTHLELDTGELVRLPRRTPGGTVEGWRERHHGQWPDPRLPQEWRLSEQEAMQQFWLLNNGGIFLAIMLVNLMNALFDPPLPVFVVAYIAVMGLLAFALQHRPVRAVRADERGLTLPSRRHKHIPWSQVQDLRRKSRYEPGAIVVLTSGQQREVLGPDLDVLTEWWHLAVPADRRPASAAD